LKALILAAGLGTRLKPLTNNKPKALVEINGTPLIEYAIMHLKYYGVNDIIINIHHLGEQLIAFVKQKKSFGINIQFSDERAELLDTGGAIVKAKDFFDNDDFLVYASDVITNFSISDFIAEHKSQQNLASLAVKKRETTRSLLFDANMHLCGWRNNANGETIESRNISGTADFGFSGIHCISPRIFEFLPKSGPFSITQWYLKLAEENIINGFNQSAYPWYEFGRLERLKATEKQIIDSHFSLEI
jgi:MurNAc alpha-1-phosphate uridylyltransferase